MELGSAACHLEHAKNVKATNSGEAHICRQEKTSNKDKAPEEHEQKNEPSKIVHKLTITVDKETLKGWDNPLGFMDGGYGPVWGEFDDGVIVKINPSITLECDDFNEVYLCKDNKKVAFASPYFLFGDPIRIEYNGEEYYIQLEEGL